MRGAHTGVGKGVDRPRGRDPLPFNLGGGPFTARRAGGVPQEVEKEAVLQIHCVRVCRCVYMCACGLTFKLSYILNEPGTTERYCLAHFFKKSLLWDTSSRAPLYLLQAAMRASTDSKSRKLVGSSMMRR